MTHNDLNNQEKLEAIYKMTIDNHKVLKSIHNQQLFSNILRIIYWLIVLGIIGGAYYFVKPVVNKISDSSNKIEETYTQLRSQLPETKIVNQIIDGLKLKDINSSDGEMIDNGVIDYASTTTN